MAEQQQPPLATLVCLTEQPDAEIDVYIGSKRATSNTTGRTLIPGKWANPFAANF